MANKANDVIFDPESDTSDMVLKTGIAIVAAVVAKLIWMAAESLLEG